MAALSGEWRDVRGSIRLFGTEIATLPTAARRALGLRYVPEERIGHAAVASMGLHENVALTADRLRAGGLMRYAEAARLAAALIARHAVRASGPRALAASLSGGNLQKFVVGRELDGEPRVLLASQPTWGVDVGASAAIRNELIARRDAGCAVLVVSEDLDELFELSDRLFVMSKGRLSPAVRPREISVQDIGRWMSGLWPGCVGMSPRRQGSV